MSESTTNKYHAFSPPRTQGWSVVTVEQQTYNVGQGLVAVLSVTTSPQFLNLVSLFAPPANSQDAWAMPNAQGVAPGLTDCFVTIQPDGSDVGVVFGQSLAAVSGPYAPSLAAAGGLGSSGTYTPNGGECARLLAGTNPQRFHLAPNTDNWLAFVGAGTGLLRIYQSSPQIC